MEFLFGIVLQLLLLLYACTLCNCVLVGSPPPEPGRTSRGTAAAVQVGFYNKTCPRAEDVIRAQVQKRFLIDKSITPALLRMLFHDSFVRGADASILLDSKPGHEAEKEALPNLTIRGFDLIDEAKDAVEAVCPGVVSCADILVLAVRDSVALAGGPEYEVPTGRLDGKVSMKEEALNLPSPAFPVEQSLESFRQKGLDLEDMVALLGAHTVGVALCGFFNDRLFNFHGTGMADPTMNTQLVTRLSTVCPNPFFTESNADPPINLDQSTPALFDAAYYTQILAGNGILQIDQEITADPSTIGLVQSFTSATTFFPAFIRSIIKMGNIDVLTGNSPLGEIRRKCNVSNPPGGTGTTLPPSKPGHATPPAPVTKPAPAGPVTKPAPAGHASKPPAVNKPAPTGHVSKPPATPKPTPTGHVSKPPAASKPTPPSSKPTPAAPVSRPPATAKPTPSGPVSKPTPAPPKPTPAGSVRKPPPASTPTPTGPVPKQAPAAPKPTPPGPVSKPPVAPKPPPAGHFSKPPAASKPTPPGHVSKPAPAPGGHFSPAARPGPSGRLGKSPIPKPPFRQVSKPPFTPATPGHASKSPAGHGSRSSTGHISKPPVVHVSRPSPEHVSPPPL